MRQEVLGSLAVESLLLGVRRWQRSGEGTRLRALVDAVFDEMLGLEDGPGS